MPKPRRPVDLSRDHARPRTAPAPASEAVELRLTDLITPAMTRVGDAYGGLGLRARVLTLPVMVGVVLAMIWRQVPSVSELVRVLAREGLFWVPRQPITQQALSLRLRVLPAELFAGVFAALLPTLQARAAERRRPLPPVVSRLQPHFPQVWAADGTTLEALFKKVGLLREAAGAPLGGTVLALLDVASKLPVALWVDPDPAANDLRFRAQIQAALPPRTLLVVDRGFYAFGLFDWLTEHGHGVITQARSLAAFTVTETLTSTPRVRDQVIALGVFRSNPCAHPMRLIEVQVGSTWRRYLTNVCDPAVLSPADVVDLYGRRWRIEEAFGLVKRLLGLSYLWSGAANAIALQVWATWLLYAVLIDLTDAVAEELDHPLDALSIEMVYRGLYHFAGAFQRGLASDPVAYLADPANRDLGIVKRPRPKRERDRLAALPTDLNL
jgi:hypothetical protein